MGVLQGLRTDIKPETLIFATSDIKPAVEPAFRGVAVAASTENALGVIPATSKYASIMEGQSKMLVCKSLVCLYVNLVL